MLELHNNLINFRTLTPESIWLESEDFDRAENNSIQANESEQWQFYLNTLGLSALEKWLKERMPGQSISAREEMIENTVRLEVGDFKICAIVTDNLLDELVQLPKNVLESPELATHFYLILEVLEEEEEVIFRGCLDRDRLSSYHQRVIPLEDDFYHLPLSLFDAEPNHLLFYCRFLEPASISLPIKTVQTTTETIEYVRENATKLSQWLQNVFDETWLTVESLISPGANLEYGLRNADKELKRAKLIDLGMQLGEQNIILLMKIKEDNEKLAVSVQLHPARGENYLPPNLKLILLSKAEKTLQEVESRTRDNCILLKSFKGEKGKRFKIRVSLGDLSVTENFEL